MFITLLSVTFAIACGVSYIVAKMFKNPVDSIFQRIIDDDISSAWSKYLQFAIYVVGISKGVRIWELEKYISPREYPKVIAHVERLADSLAYSQEKVLTLTMDRWVLELYRTIIETLQGIAWTLMAFFIVALIAYVIVRVLGGKRVSTKDM